MLGTYCIGGLVVVVLCELNGTLLTLNHQLRRCWELLTHHCLVGAVPLVEEDSIVLRVVGPGLPELFVELLLDGLGLLFRKKRCCFLVRVGHLARADVIKVVSPVRVVGACIASMRALVPRWITLELLLRVLPTLRRE